MNKRPESSGRAASVGREPTANPEHFLIPAAQLPPGFAEGVERSSERPTEAIPAATVVLVRPGSRGPEVLLLRRPSRSSFAAGAWVFPGGRVDESDGDARIARLWDGPSAGEWRRRLEVDTDAEAIGYVAAAIREAWEETGIVLATGCAGSTKSLSRAREEILLDRLSLREACEREAIRLSTADLHYIAHWVTPEAEPKRYDTRFFLARVAVETMCLLQGDELVESNWIRPAEAVRLNGGSALKLLPPTLHTLRRLAVFASMEEMWSTLRDAPVRRILPVMRRDPKGIIIDISP